MKCIAVFNVIDPLVFSTVNEYVPIRSYVGILTTSINQVIIY